MLNPIETFAQKTNTKFSFFLFVLFVIAIADAIMSYVTPIFLDNHIKNTFMVGLVFSTSSMFGFAYDIYAGANSKGRNFRYFLISTCIMSLLFPLILLFGPNRIVYYVLAMAIWGFYYETRSFSMFNYIKSYVPKSSYPMAWGMISNMSSIAYLIGPIAASYFLITSLELPVYIALGLFILGFILVQIFLKLTKSNNTNRTKLVKKEKITAEFRIWRILSGKIWIVWIMWFLLWGVDAAFWGIGIILAEKLKIISSYGIYLLPAYMIPKTFMGVAVPGLSSYGGKKYLTFVSSIIGGAALIFMGLEKEVQLILFFTFVGSAAFSVALTALSATFEDYIDRLGKFAPELIGLEQSASSLGYVISPIVSFAIASVLTEQHVFVVLGTLVTFWASLSLVLIPRKIKMPQKLLKNLN